jgi:hypothetical protein
MKGGRAERDLIKHRKPGSLGQVRVSWLCRKQMPRKVWNTGMMEYWVWRKEIHFYIDGTDQKIKSDHHPFCNPNIPFFHHSIIPLVI